MAVSFNAQPFNGGRDLRDFFDTVAADDDLTRLDIVVAWAKRSGLRRIRTQLETIGARAGSETLLIVGIDEGGATREGLELAREIFDRVYVFHDNSRRTFHPKIYLATGTERARLWVGSNNLTAGGVYFNYEAALELDLQLPAGQPTVDEVRQFITQLTDDLALCLELTDERLAELIADPRYRISTEAQQGGAHAVGQGAPEDVDMPTEPAGPLAPSMFGQSIHAKRADPLPPAKKAPAKKAPAKKAPAQGGAHAAGAGADVVRRWFRNMDATASQHPPSGNPTHNLRLTLGNPRLPIDKYVWFRHDLFGHLDWSQEQRDGEVVEVARGEFHVDELGTDRGTHELEISHAPHREEHQHNIPTVLHWGSVEPMLAATNHTGRKVIIEGLADGTFNLRITDEAPTVGDFLE